MEATRVIHAHAHGEFSERLGRAIGILFEGAYFGMELYGNKGSYAVETNIPFNEKRRDGILQRTSELVPVDNPIFAELIKRETRAMRLSDFISLRQFRTTHLYHEVFRDVGVDRQVALPIYAPACVGAVTILRGGRDFTAEHMAMASWFSSQIAVAFESDQMISRLKLALPQAEVDYTTMRRLGLTRRESEVMVWIIDGKRDGEIAVILGISVRTVNQHVGAILAKLNVETRTAAAALIISRMGQLRMG